ncbi:putative membrane protein [Corynebacterium ulcerans 0102]|nr:putative membrane protein [Corynebacterium ulcerans 0102]
MWGVLLGASIGGGFVLLTALSVLATSNTSAATTGAIVLGGWLLKIVVLIIVLVGIRNLEFYDKYAFLVTLVLALVVVLACEVWGVITSKVTYVS